MNVKLMLYSTLALPYISYCCSIWGSNDISRLNRLSVLQKRIVRIIGNKPYNAHTTPLFYTLKQLKSADLVKFSLCKILYKAFHNELPNNIQMLFSTVQTVHSHATRQQNYMFKKSVRTNVKYMSVSVAGVNIWNTLKDDSVAYPQYVFCTLDLEGLVFSV